MGGVMNKKNEYRLFFDHSHDLMMRVSCDGAVLEVNKQWCERLGHDPDHYLGENWIEWVYPDDYEQVNIRCNGKKKESVREGVEFRLMKQDGSALWVKMDDWAQEDLDERYLIFKDISIQKRFEEELHRIELTDELSGAYNRRHLLNRAFEELLRSVRYESDISLLLIDIDRLTAINEEYGQFTGDQVIRKIAQICMNALRNTDLFGRMGAGEFACLLVETPISGADIIAERIRRAIAENELAMTNCSLSVTVTVGLCGRREGDVSIEEILIRAQNALGQGKSFGGNCVQKWSQ